VLVVSRFAVPESEGESFTSRSELALGTLAARPGYIRGHVGRAVDDPTRWVRVTEWAGVGAYRRALSSFDVKIGAVPLLAESVDEPSVYEVLLDDGGPHLSDRANG
jgi:heme oxygenase (mycobilin-producing)